MAFAQHGWAQGDPDLDGLFRPGGADGWDLPPVRRLRVELCGEPIALDHTVDARWCPIGPSQEACSASFDLPLASLGEGRYAWTLPESADRRREARRRCQLLEVSAKVGSDIVCSMTGGTLATVCASTGPFLLGCLITAAELEGRACRALIREMRELAELTQDDCVERQHDGYFFRKGYGFSRMTFEAAVPPGVTGERVAVHQEEGSDEDVSFDLRLDIVASPAVLMATGPASQDRCPAYQIEAAAGCFDDGSDVRIAFFELGASDGRDRELESFAATPPLRVDRHTLASGGLEAIPAGPFEARLIRGGRIVDRLPVSPTCTTENPLLGRWVLDRARSDPQLLLDGMGTLDWIEFTPTAMKTELQPGFSRPPGSRADASVGYVIDPPRVEVVGPEGEALRFVLDGEGGLVWQVAPERALHLVRPID